MILLLQYGVVSVVAYLLVRTDLNELNKVSIRQRRGNLYFTLDTRSRSKVLYGVIFFLQRILLVLILAISYDFGVQWQLSQVVLLLHTSYLLAVKPYRESTNATLDWINCCFVLIINVLITTCSAWNPDSRSRFSYGIVFDVLVGKHFLVNIILVSA